MKPILVVMLTVFSAAGLADRAVARAVGENSPPVDPVVEEPIRPLFPETPGPTIDRTLQCGPMGLPVLAIGFLLLATLRLTSASPSATTRHLTEPSLTRHRGLRPPSLCDAPAKREVTSQGRARGGPTQRVHSGP